MMESLPNGGFECVHPSRLDKVTSDVNDDPKECKNRLYF